SLAIRTRSNSRKNWRLPASTPNESSLATSILSIRLTSDELVVPVSAVPGTESPLAPGRALGATSTGHPRHRDRHGHDRTEGRTAGHRLRRHGLPGPHGRFLGHRFD